MAVSSSAEIWDMMDVASIISTNWLISDGYIFSTACGSMACQITRQRFRPRHSAASSWPLGIDFDASADDLGGIGRHIDDQREHRGRQRRHPHMQGSEAEEQPECLDHQRRIAYQVDVPGRRLFAPHGLP